MLAAAYPGIPNDYTAWHIDLKQAYADNIAKTLAELDYQRRRALPDGTVEGVYRSVLMRTGDKELAEQVKAVVAFDAKVKALEHSGG